MLFHHHHNHYRHYCTLRAIKKGTHEILKRYFQMRTFKRFFNQILKVNATFCSEKAEI